MDKPGWMTTEFWVAIAGSVFGFLAAMGWIAPDQVSGGTAAIGQIAGGVIVLVGIISYIWSRVSIKKIALRRV